MARAEKELSELQRRQMHNLICELKGNIRVYCRIRPSPDEEAGAVFDLNDGNNKALQIQHPEGRENASGERVERAFDFSYDHVFGPASQQDEVFEEISQLVQSALDGYQVCLLSYGQTGFVSASFARRWRRVPPRRHRRDPQKSNYKYTQSQQREN